MRDPPPRQHATILRFAPTHVRRTEASSRPRAARPRFSAVTALLPHQHRAAADSGRAPPGLLMPPRCLARETPRKSIVMRERLAKIRRIHENLAMIPTC